MSIAMNRARLPFVLLTSVLVASCAAPTTRPGVRGQWRKPASPPAFATLNDDKPPMILPETYYAAARLLESRGRYLDARERYRKAVTVNHTYVDAFHRLGLVHSLLGERDLAVEALARAVELKPEDSILRNNLGFEYILCERWAEANDELSAAIEFDPGFARAHINLGIVQSRMQRFDLALASFRTALPEADAHYNLGLMYRGQGRYAEATVSFERVLDIDPEFAAAWKQLRQVRASAMRKAKDTNVDVPAPDVTRTTTDATGDSVPASSPTRMAKAPTTAVETDRPSAQVGGPVTPRELAGSVDLMTADIGYLMALVDRDRERLVEYESAHAATSVGESIERQRSHEPVESAKNSRSVALENAYDESEPGMAPTPYGEDMPNHFEIPGTTQFSFLPEEDLSVAPSDTPELSRPLRQGEFIAPQPMIAWEADWIVDTYNLENDCDDFLLIDIMGDVGPWFSVPTPIQPVTRTADVFSAQPDPIAPDPSIADAPMIFAAISSFGRNGAEPVLKAADPISGKPVAVASIDARTALQQFNDELAQVREEIQCLESMDEEPAHVTFAMANDLHAPTRAGEIPTPLHWMLDMKSRTHASGPALRPMVSSPRAEMGPPAPAMSFVTTNRGASIRPVRARLTASSADQPWRGKHEVRSFRLTEHELRDSPAVTPNETASLGKRAQLVGETVNPDDMGDIDGWIAIVMNELACLEDSARDAPAWPLDDSFDSRHSIGWRNLDVYDRLIFPNDPRSRE
ncbi:MAG: tetratricopeptide repeat protein [Planctomycetes bacterium]|nr:tetratricopeptide repeat protein [Planctomycetota bacterium]